MRPSVFCSNISGLEIFLKALKKTLSFLYNAIFVEFVHYGYHGIDEGPITIFNMD